MQFMFSGASVFDGDLSAWDVSSVTDMQWMFSSASAFNQDVSTWNVAKVTEMYAMFNMATSFNQDVSTWDVGEVVSMNQMFWDATSFDQDISGWNVGKVTNLNNMFTNTQFQYDLSAWDVGNVNFMNEMFHGTNYSFTLCGDAWVNSAASQTDFGTNITGPCPDNCPYNLCREITHATGGVCSAGVCACPIPVEGRRCDAACPGNRYNFADGCDACIPGFAKTGGACRNASVSETQFLSGFKAGKTKSARAKAVRNALRPMRDAKKTLKENTVSVPMVTADLSDAQLVLIQEIEAKIGGTVELKMAIAAEQTAPLENPSAAQCTYDVNDQEAGKKTVFHAYGVDNYMYLCDTFAGSMVFVAEVKEGVNGSAVRCRGESGWDAEVIKAPGETHTCNGTPFLIGSATLECGPDEGCCSSAECGHGTCTNLACVCDAGWEGATCNSPTDCADITESELYQKKGCCDC
jgi:surface protein